MTLSLAAAPFFDDIHTERVEGYGTFFHTYEFSIPSNHPSAAFAVPKGTVVFPGLDGDTKCFTIKSVSEESSPDGLYKRVECEDAAQDELTCTIVEPVMLSAETDESLLAEVLAGTRWQVGTTEGDKTVTTDVEWSDYPNVWECVLWIAEHYNLEVQTRVMLSGTEIAERYIDLVRTRGTYSGQVLNYARDTAAVTRSGDGGEIFTAVYGLGADSEGAPIDFGSIVWSTPGDPVDKPNGQLWVGLESARLGDDSVTPSIERYGIDVGGGVIKHRFGVFRDSEEDNAAHLLDKTYAYLVEHSKPRYTYDVSVVALERMPLQRPTDSPRRWERLRVGDTVVVRDTACYPPYQDEVRVIEVRRSYSDPTKDSVTLGMPMRRVSDYMKDLVRLQRKLNI
jgi:hypothetical protein